MQEGGKGSVPVVKSSCQNRRKHFSSGSQIHLLFSWSVNGESGKEILSMSSHFPCLHPWPLQNSVGEKDLLFSYQMPTLLRISFPNKDSISHNTRTKEI